MGTIGEYNYLHKMQNQPRKNDKLFFLRLIHLGAFETALSFYQMRLGVFAPRFYQAFAQ